jgi:MerR family redox-sensitive transcriptional activator SoxR
MLLIGQVAQESGVAASAIRYYEELGLVQPIERRSGRRLYGEQAVNRLKAVRAAREAGFSLEEIGRLLDSQRDGTDEWRELVEAKIDSVEALVDRLRTVTEMLRDSLTCSCRAWDECSIPLARRTVAPSPTAAKATEGGRRHGRRPERLTAGRNRA